MTTGVGAPTGPIRTPAPQGGPFGLDWSAVNRWDADLVAAADAEGVPADRLKGHMVIESGGEPTARQVNAQGDSCGLLQVVPRWWRGTVERLAGVTYKSDNACCKALCNDPALALRAGASVLAQLRMGGSWDDASSRFFTGSPGWGGRDTVNETTGRQYRDALAGLMREINAAVPAGPTAPPVPAPAPADPLSLIVRVPFRDDYGFRDDVGLDFYLFGVGHGTDASTQHTGIDIGLAVGTPLFAPGPGIVDCVGAAGTVRWGQGCGAYLDDAGGAGNVTILLDLVYQGSPVKLTLGHCRSALVRPGQRVQAGQQVATSGVGNGGAHVHVETSIQRNGSYWLVDPRLSLASLAGQGGPVAPPPRAYPSAPAWLTDDMIVALFPDCTSGRPRSELWLATAKATGRAPRYVATHNEGEPGELLEFSDGSFITTSGEYAR